MAAASFLFLADVCAACRDILVEGSVEAAR
jgi:hypothetical protein